MADYYLLNAASLPPFLPLLPPELRNGAAAPPMLTAGAVEDGTAIAAAVLRREEGGARLEDLVVAPEYRRRGVARGLLSYLRTVLPLLDCDGLWADLAPELGEDAPMVRLLSGLGLTRENGPAVASCSVAALWDSPLLAPLLERDIPGVVPLGGVPAPVLRACRADLLQSGVTAAPLDWDAFDPELSFCGLNAKGALTCCVCTRTQPHDISVEWIYAAPAGAQQLILAVAALLRAARTRLPADAVFSAVLLNDRAAHLLARLAGDAATYRYASHWEWDLLRGLESEE